MLDLEVTRRCNLRCDYCFVGWSRDWHADLPRDVAEQIVREGAPHFDTLHITGGEPLAWRGLFDLVELALALGYAEVLINTNGTLLDAAAIARLEGHGGRVRLSVSFDGPREAHDAIRGAGRFDESDANLRAAVAAQIPVTVMTVVTPDVLQVLPQFLFERMAAHPQLEGITLFPVGVGPSGSQKHGVELVRLSPEDLRVLATLVALSHRSGVPVTVGAYPLINPLLKQLGYPESRLYQCTAGRGRICVHADQSVSTCHPVRDPIYGSWSSGLFGRIEANAAHARVRARDFDGCRSCSHREECGHCRAFVTASGADFFGNDRVCLEVVPGRLEEARRSEELAADSHPSTRRVSLPLLP